MKIYDESFDRSYQQVYEARESLREVEFRFQDNLLVRTYNKFRHIRQGGILLYLKLKLGFDEFV